MPTHTNLSPRRSKGTTPPKTGTSTAIPRRVTARSIQSMPTFPSPLAAYSCYPTPTSGLSKATDTAFAAVTAPVSRRYYVLTLTASPRVFFPRTCYGFIASRISRKLPSWGKRRFPPFWPSLVLRFRIDGLKDGGSTPYDAWLCQLRRYSATDPNGRIPYWDGTKPRSPSRVGVVRFSMRSRSSFCPSL